MEDDNALLPGVPVPAAAASATGREAAASATAREMAPFPDPDPSIAASSHSAAALSAATGQEMVLYQHPDIPGPSSHSHSGGGGGQMQQAPGVHVTEQITNLQLHNQGHQEFDINYANSLVNRQEWLELYQYTLTFLPEEKPWTTHPMLIMHIQRAWLLDYIKTGKFDYAVQFFLENIKQPFQPVLELDQSLVRNASILDLTQEINFLECCVNDKICYEHTYSAAGILPTLLHDYLLLYLPNNRFNAASRKQTDLWQFAIELRRTSKSTFRCLVCSTKVFKSGTIGEIVKHLQLKCKGSKNTPYLIEKYKACGFEITPTQIQQLQQAVLPTTTQIQQPQQDPIEPGSRKRFRSADIEQDTAQSVESILQAMGNEVTKVEHMATNVGMMHNDMRQSVQTMKGLLASALAAFSTGSKESQPVIGAEPIVVTSQAGNTGPPVAVASSSIAPSATATHPVTESDLLETIYDAGWVPRDQ